MPLFKAVHLAENFDIAIMSTKGMSVTAARLLVDRLNIPLLVLHDFDKSGFSIFGTLSRSGRRYTFENDLEVIDLGLRLKDVQKWHLESVTVIYGKSNPTRNLLKNGATKEEVAFLFSNRSLYPNYSGQRVEINAFTSADLITWLEGSLIEHGIKKVIPDKDILDEAYQRSARAKFINERLSVIVEEAAQQNITVPKNLEKQVKRMLQKEPSKSWDSAVADLVEEVKL